MAIRDSTFAIRHSRFDIRDSTFSTTIGARYAAVPRFDIRNSTFAIRHSQFDIRNSPFSTTIGARYAAVPRFDIRNSTFAIRHSQPRSVPATRRFRDSTFAIRHSQFSMVLELNLTKLIARLALAIGALAGCSLLIAIIISRFVVGTLADDRLAVTRDMLQVPVEYFPGSARLNARLAAAELSESDRDLARAEAYAQRAVNLSPYDYRFRLTLASIKEAGGDRSAAEESLESARALAPNYWSVHYRLANLLLREGKLNQSLDEFRIAVTANRELLPGTLDLMWRASRGDVNAVQTASGSDPKAKLTLAQFLLKVSRPAEAASIFSSIDRSDLIASSPESSAFLTSLIAAGKLETAHDFWSDLAGGDRQSTLIWNGGFESNIAKNLAQFDWSFGQSEYARLAIDAAVARTGSRSLRIEFAGRDTTQLDNEVKQLVLLRPGTRYRLECYAKTSGLESPEGPRVVVTDSVSPAWIVASEPVAQGSSDWQRLTVDFMAPQNVSGGASAVFVSIKRKPKFSYDEPTRGTVWFDDFSMKEQ